MGTKALRPARTLAFAIAASALAILSHTAASGQVPDLFPAIAVGIVGLTGAWIAGSVRRDALWIAVYLMAMQGLTHLVLWVTSAHGHAHEGLLPDTRMLLAHLLAAIVAAGILTRAEQIAHAWLCLTAWTSPPRWAPVIPNTHALPPTPRTSQFTRIQLYVLESLPRRGPPLTSFG